MEKPSTIKEIVSILDSAMKQYPGPGLGLKKYRRRDSDGDYPMVGYIWSDIPIRYVSLLTGLTKDEMQRIHRIDKQGSISMGSIKAACNEEVLSISVFGSRAYHYED